jgi:uncharacterized protein (DUF697 family)
MAADGQLVVPHAAPPTDRAVDRDAAPDPVEAIRRRCRRLVTRRALVSAAASVVPLPGFDIAVDIGMLLQMINEINHRFGLSPQQIEGLAPHRKALVYQAVTVVGSALVGRVLTRELMLGVLLRVGVRLSAAQAAKLVPIAGQALAATISFGALKLLGDRHVDDCARIAAQLRDLGDPDDLGHHSAPR